MIRTSQRKTLQNIIYTFKKQIISKNDDEKGVKDVYYMTHHVHVMCVSFSFEKVESSSFTSSKITYIN
jgi:hypothetical protein